MRQRRKSINRRRCLACKARSKHCDIKPNGASCSYCAKKKIECKLPRFETIRYFGPALKTHYVNSVKKCDTETNQKNNCKWKVNSLLQKIMIDYLNCAYDSEKDEPKIPTIKSNGLYHIYNTRSEYSSSCDQIILDEKLQTIPLINEKTLFEEQTRLIYCTSLVSVSEFDNSLPLYTMGNITKHNGTQFDILYCTKEEIQFPTTALKCSEKVPIKNISIDGLKNELFIEAPSLVRDFNSNPSSSTDVALFVNIPHYIPKELTHELFVTFCSNFPSESNKFLFYLTDEISFSEHFMREMLNVFLPLGFSNITVFKTMLLWAIHYLNFINGNTSGNSRIQKDYKNIAIQLHAEIIEDLNKRITYRSSVCCDHTLAIVVILLELQRFKTLVEHDYWKRLTALTIDVISLRGGLKHLSITDNGSLLAKMFTHNFFFCFGFSISKHNMEYIHIDDLLSTYFQPSVGDKDIQYSCIKKLCGVIGQILHLHTLMRIAEGKVEIFGGLKKNSSEMNLHILSKVVSDATLLESELSNIEHLENMQILQSSGSSIFVISELLRRCGFSLLLQIIYKTPSISTLSVLNLAKSMPLVYEAFRLYMSGDPLLAKIYLILPLFVVGCDIIGESGRSCYKSNLMKLYSISGKKKIISVIKLLEKVWNCNDNGVKFVSWTEMAESFGIVLPIYV